MSTRLGAVLRLASVLLVLLALAWIVSPALATGPGSGHLITARAGHRRTESRTSAVAETRFAAENVGKIAAVRAAGVLATRAKKN